MTDVLSWAEIRHRIANEWVLIVELQTAPDLSPLCGRVAAHGPDRDEVRCRAMELQPRSSTVGYTGELVMDDDYCISAWFEDGPVALDPETTTAVPTE